MFSKKLSEKSQKSEWPSEVAVLIEEHEAKIAKRKERKQVREKSGKIAEAKILTDIQTWLKQMRLRHWRNNVQGNIVHTGKDSAVQAPSSRAGSSDIEGQLPDGRYFCIEVKKPGWKPPTPPKSLKASKAWAHYSRQKNWIDETNANNGIGFFATSLEQVQEMLGSYVRRR